jgi:exonuclease SbcC
LLKIHQFDSVDSVQAILSKIWDVGAVADSEKLLMNQILISKCLKIKNLEECKLTYEAQLGKVPLQDNLKRINRSWQKSGIISSV